MCGFVGYTGKIKNNKSVIKKMLDRIIHRGPDQMDLYSDDNITLGFRRLSIIDVAAPSQPIFNEDKSLALLFNGEIYNYRELREELINKGHIFQTKTDSEVLIHLYEEENKAMVHKLRGMFAFVIYNFKDNSLFMARDHFGIKPLYYYKTQNDNYLFGSEIKSFLDHPEFEKSLNKKLIQPYLCFQYSAILDETFFKGVYKVPPGHTLYIDKDEFKVEKYWDINFKSKSDSYEKNIDKYISETENVVKDSVKVHKNSEVPVGSFLSGGIDSSYITALLKPEKTFSVGFNEEGFSENDLAKDLSDILKIENHRRKISGADCFDNLSDIVYHLDEPQSNPSTLPLYFLAELASEHVTVVLSGEGADEIFAGYEWYEEDSRTKIYRKLPKNLRLMNAKIVEKLPNFKGRTTIIRNCGKPENYFIGQAQIFEDREANKILRDNYKSDITTKKITLPLYTNVLNKDELTKKQYLDLKLWLAGDILLKADKISMAHSLELRVPFLDKEVMSMAQNIPVDYRIYNGESKHILREASKRVLPKDWSKRKKKGFPVPIRIWLKDEYYYNKVKSKFNSRYSKKIFNNKEILKLLEDHYCGKRNNARKIWTIYVFLVWYERFFILENKNVSIRKRHLQMNSNFRYNTKFSQKRKAIF